MAPSPFPQSFRRIKLPPQATASGRHAEVAMNDELAARHRAITLRLAGRTVKSICAALGRTRAWFHKWWRRYLESGTEGLYDLTRANHRAQRIPPELERTILSIRRRLQAHAAPATRYSLIGAGTIRAELNRLGVRPSDDPGRWAQGASSRRRFLAFPGRDSLRASLQLEMFAPGIRPADTLPSWCRAHL